MDRGDGRVNPHLNHALALLYRIENVPRGGLTDHFITMAADELTAGGRPDLAERVHGQADDVMAELWRVE